MEADVSDQKKVLYLLLSLVLLLHVDGLGFFHHGCDEMLLLLQRELFSFSEI
ncbi:hypothetical protein C1H46_015240 [Malus baccata]|uniref:Uncharacterized protein n=1 Tax=Malus baccata TaxID=106549 RepID=A0A540MK12_MALBA|nr:hypothetical protein C1H46_015240 [Malus baccata]